MGTWDEAASTAAPERRVEGHRERKKRDTHRALMRSARELVHANGLDRVTVDDIADAAGVSVRTFFNYFSCKEEAVVGIDPDMLVDLADEMRLRLLSEGVVEALRAILVPEDDADAALRSWQLRSEVVERYPALLPRHLATMVQVEEALADAIADSTGVDPARDPRPRIVVAAVLAAIRSSLSWWESSDRSVPLDEVLDRACGCISADGSPPVHP